MDITTKYIRIINNDHDKSNYIKISFHYDIGGANCFTGREKRRGYYLTVVPVTRERGLESFIAFTGCSELLQECARKSAKAEKAASEKIPVMEKYIVNYIIEKYGYMVEV